MNKTWSDIYQISTKPNFVFCFANDIRSRSLFIKRILHNEEMIGNESMFSFSTLTLLSNISSFEKKEKISTRRDMKKKKSVEHE